MNPPPEQFERPRRAKRRDGQATRDTILEAAGKVFAELGYSDATSKEICARAGVNSAAVNYYFGGKEQLYEAVLAEGHQHLVSLEDLNEIIASDLDAENKLRALFERLIRTATASSGLWGVKVFVRELASPSPSVTSALPGLVFPKVALLYRLIHELTGFSPDSARAQRAVAFVVMPCLSLIMFPERLRARILPATAPREEGLLEDMLCYALGGLRALKDAVE